MRPWRSRTKLNADETTLAVASGSAVVWETDLDLSYDAVSLVTEQYLFHRRAYYLAGLDPNAETTERQPPDSLAADRPASVLNLPHWKRCRCSTLFCSWLICSGSYYKPRVADNAKFFRALGVKVRRLRKQHRLSQEDMLSFGFSTRHWQQIEAGRPITVTTLLRICEVFGTPMARLVQRLDAGIYERVNPESLRRGGRKPS